MRINTNINAIMIRNELTSHSKSIDMISERLSSGKRINRAADDAAGLAISERMTSDIKGSAQAIRNANDGIAFMQTAEGALSQIETMLQRSRELVIQGANGTNSAGNKAIIQQEIEQVSLGIKDILRGTTFNNQDTFVDASELTGNVGLEFWLKNSWVPESSKLIEDHFGITGRGQNIELVYTGDGVGNTLASVSFTGFDASFGGSKTLKLNVDPADFIASGYPSGDATSFTQDRIIAHEVVHAVMAVNMDMSVLPGWFTEGAAEFIHGADDRVSGDIGAGSASAFVSGTTLKTTPGSPSGSAPYSLSYVAVRMLDEAIRSNGGNGIKDIMTGLATGGDFSTLINAHTGDTLATFETSVSNDGASFIDTKMNLSDADTGSIHGSDFGNDAKSSIDVISNQAVADDPNLLNLTGLTANEEETTIGFQLGSTDASRIVMDKLLINIDALSGTGAKVTDTEDALEKIDIALKAVSKHQGILGTFQNRLGHSINSLRVFHEQTSTARSVIIDADFAKETTALSRSQVITQAAQAMLAQANSQPQQVLSLLQ